MMMKSMVLALGHRKRRKSFWLGDTNRRKSTFGSLSLNRRKITFSVEPSGWHRNVENRLLALGHTNRRKSTLALGDENVENRLFAWSQKTSEIRLSGSGHKSSKIDFWLWSFFKLSKIDFWLYLSPENVENRLFGSWSHKSSKIDFLAPRSHKLSKIDFLARSQKTSKIDFQALGYQIVENRYLAPVTRRRNRFFASLSQIVEIDFWFWSGKRRKTDFWFLIWQKTSKIDFCLSVTQIVENRLLAIGYRKRRKSTFDSWWHKRRKWLLALGHRKRRKSTFLALRQ